MSQVWPQRDRHGRSLPLHGLYRFSCRNGKECRDLNLFTAALMQFPEAFDTKGGFRGLRLAFLNVDEWRLPDKVSNWPGDTRGQMVSIECTEREALTDPLPG